MFSWTCTDILDSIAPLKPVLNKDLAMPRQNEATRILRRLCRRGKRKRATDRLHVSFQILCGCLANYQKAVRAAKWECISTTVSNLRHKPEVLPSVQNPLIDPRDQCPLVPVPAPSFMDIESTLWPAHSFSISPHSANLLSSSSSSPSLSRPSQTQSASTNFHSYSSAVRRHVWSSPELVPILPDRLEYFCQPRRFLSSVGPLICGVTQGSIQLGPILSTCYP